MEGVVIFIRNHGRKEGRKEVIAHSSGESKRLKKPQLGYGGLTASKWYSRSKPSVPFHGVILGEQKGSAGPAWWEG